MTDWTEIEQARAKAHAKHGDNSIEGITADDPRWLSILVEEVGEVSHELTYDATGSLRAEIVDVLAVASAWLDALDGPREKSHPTELPRARHEAAEVAQRLHQRATMTRGSSGDMRVMFEAASMLMDMSRRELDNHHAADLCPYCTPDPEQRRTDRAVDIMREFYRG